MPHIIFYGLFMDEALLNDKGLHPKIIGPARLDNYRIRIVGRATLVQDPGAAAFGIVMKLTGKEVEVLYTAPGLDDYRSELVDVVMLNDGLVQQVSCYNLPAASMNMASNAQYTMALTKLVNALDFPDDYVREICAQGDIDSLSPDGSD